MKKFFAPCPRGLESLLGEELTALGAHELSATRGGVAFVGDWRLACRANLESRLATRILWRVGHGRYRNEEDVYRLAYGLTWAKWFDIGQRLRVDVTMRRSSLRSLNFITLRIKDAVCDHFRTVCGARPSVDTAQPDVRVYAFLDREEISLYLDLSGEALLRRGFKKAHVEAPLKENLAAGILRLSGWQAGQPLVDPMCGSGTFLLEAAQIALDIAPGLGRNFALQKLRNFDAALWQQLLDAARARQRPLQKLPIWGYDISPRQCEAARTNLAAMGVHEAVEVECADLLDLPAPVAGGGVMVANPPYGVRLGEVEKLLAFYPHLGDALKANWAGWNCYFLSSDENLAKKVRLKASRRTPLFNGALECRLYEYRMVAGSHRSNDKKGAGDEAQRSSGGGGAATTRLD